MKTEYIEKAMAQAQYEELPGKRFLGKIPVFGDAVFAIDEDQEKCKADLREALENRILFLEKNDGELPVLD